MAEQESGKKTWIKACGIGCLVLLVIAAGAAFGVYKLVAGKLAEGSAIIAAQTAEDFAQAKADGKVPEEYVALFESVVGAAQAEEASFLVVSMSAAVVVGVFDDDELSEEELADAEAVRDFLSANPDPGSQAVGTFLDENPSLKDRVAGLITQLKPE